MSSPHCGTSLDVSNIPFPSFFLTLSLGARESAPRSTLLAFKCLPGSSLWQSSSELSVVQAAPPFCKVLSGEEDLHGHSAHSNVRMQYRVSAEVIPILPTTKEATCTQQPPGDGGHWFSHDFSIDCNPFISLLTPPSRCM